MPSFPTSPTGANPTRGQRLLTVLGQVPDPRDPRGVRPLAGVLAMAVTAALAGCRSFAAIGQWAAEWRGVPSRMSVLYLHEAFHHKIESLAIRFEMVRADSPLRSLFEGRPHPAHQAGIRRRARRGSRMCGNVSPVQKRELYRRGVPKLVRDATVAMLPEWFRTLPPSYREAGRYLSDRTFDQGRRTLMSQVQEAAVSPKRAHDEWNLAPHLCRVLFDCQRIVHVLVPKGQQPILPWIGHTPALPLVSSRKAIRHLEDQGWKVDPGRSKGSYVRLKHVGKQPLTIPANRESLSPPVLKSVANALGVRLTDLAF
jgi:predicted RNA binding protein YcfA (HicA-like mRNA interferase family)